MIELAQKVWGIGAAEALFRLASEGIAPERVLEGDAIEVYVKEHQDYRRRVMDMWRRAQKRMAVVKLGAVRGLQTMNRLRLRCGKDRWANGPGQLVGSLPVRDISKVLQPMSTDKGRSQSGQRIFRGRKWDEALMFPYYDLPGRIRGFMFLGRYGNATADQVFKMIQVPGMQTPAKPLDAGLGGFRALELAGHPAAVIATDNWLLALQAQMRTFKVAMQPMAMVVWHDDGRHETNNAWHALGDRNIIFWSLASLDARIVRQAMRVDGYIAIAGPEYQTEENLQQFLRNHPGFDLQVRIRSQAKPWREALQEWMKKSRECVVDQLLLELERAGENVADVLKQCGRSGKVAGLPVVTRTVEIGRNVVTERSGEWFQETRKGLKPILNAAIRITHVVRDKHSHQLFYRGYVLYAGQRVHFLDPAEDFDANPGIWVRNLIATHGLGLIKYASSWTKRLYEVATTFSEPQLVTKELSEVARIMRQRKELVDPL
jgi:hypothetical protein